MSKNIFLADDDEDDRYFFRQALAEVCHECSLTMAENGVELMTLLNRTPSSMPDIVFLDLNMPAKNGFQCLVEIKHNAELHDLPVIIFSTTSQEEAVNATYRDGASYYIRKPTDFKQLKQVMLKVLKMRWDKGMAQPPKEKFLLSVA